MADTVRWTQLRAARVTGEMIHGHPRNADIAAPYNFVEPPDAVAPTPWPFDAAKGHTDLAHDRPRADAISGTLTVDWTFETAFLVGAAKPRNAPSRHVTYGGQPVLPGASIRGMLRNVLEIAAAARACHIDREARFAFRSWTDDPLGALWLDAVHPGKRIVDISRIKGGLLVPPDCDAFKNRNLAGWKLIPAELARIEMVEALEAMTRSRVYPSLGGVAWNDLSTPGRYHALSPAILGNFDCHVALRADPGYGAPWKQAVPVGATAVAHPLQAGAATKRGRIALVGEDPSGLNTSWLFIHSADPANEINVPSAVVDSFLRAHRIDGGRGALDFWEAKVGASITTQIPVVYVDTRTPKQKKDQELGYRVSPQKFFIALTRFLKAPHEYSVGEIANRSRPAFRDGVDGPLDFVQALFGHVPPQDMEGDPARPQTFAWKARAFFRHGELTPASQNLTERSVTGIAEKPRPSFSPYYLRPNGPGVVAHWSSDQARLAGFKRYPVRNATHAFPQPAVTAAGGNNTEMVFKVPPPGGATFRAPIRLHNVLPEELGGILWAIGFGDPWANNRPWRHACGRGKPQGYGRLKGAIASFDLETGAGNTIDQQTLRGCVSRFETWLTGALGAAFFAALDHIRELRAMADPAIGARLDGQHRLQYPTGSPLHGPGDTPSLIGYGAIKQKGMQQPAADAEALTLWRYPREID